MSGSAVISSPRPGAGGLRVRLRRGLPAARLLLPEICAVGVLTALVWAMISLALGGELSASRNEALRNSTYLARTFSDNAGRLFANIDQTLLAIRASYAANPDGFDIVDWLHRQHPIEDLAVQIGYVGPDGIVIRSTTAASKGIDISDREHFRAQLDPARDDLFISKPVLGRGSGLWQVQITRKLLRRDGSFGGIIVVSVGCDELARFYDHFATAGAVALIGMDGIVRARGPTSEWPIGASIRGEPLFGAILAETHGSQRRQNERDGGFTSFDRLEHYPLTVTVGLNRDQLLRKAHAAWQRWVAIGTVATLAVLLLGVFWIRQRLKSLASELALKTTLDNMSQGIVMIDAAGRIPVLNRRALDLLDIPDFGPTEAGDSLRRRWLATCGSAGSKDGRLECGEKIIEVESHPMPLGGKVLTYTDVTERTRHELRMRHLAMHDRLTGLANREMLSLRMAEMAARASQSGLGYAVLVMDLDGFKAVNDGLGHDVGDHVLIVTAARLLAAVRAEDTVARIGGDEFVIVLGDVEADGSTTRVAETLLSSVCEPIRVSDQVCRVGASCGIAVFPADGVSEASLLKNADVALYEAKSNGRGQWLRYSRSMRAGIEERRWLEAELRVALGRGDIRVAFQPQVSAVTLEVSGFECLARWHHAGRDDIPPSTFIPVAEDCGLISELGRAVMQQACRHAAQWQPGCRVAVNVSPVQFRDPALVKLVGNILFETGLEPHRLELEVTEGVLIRDEEQALRTLAELRSLGIQIALDDFGTGYASLSYLRRFSFDRVKIDKSFVQAQQQDGRAKAILDGIMAISHNLGLAITAEGIESEDHLAELQAQGCTDFQGYLFGRPMRPEHVAAMLGQDQRPGQSLRGRTRQPGHAGTSLPHAGGNVIRLAAERAG